MTTFFKAIVIALLAGACFIANAAACILWMYDHVHWAQLAGGFFIQVLVLHWLTLTLNQFDAQSNGNPEPPAA